MAYCILNRKAGRLERTYAYGCVRIERRIVFGIGTIDISKLSPEDRLRLLEQLWDSLSATPEAVPITDAQRDEPERRLDELDRAGRHSVGRGLEPHPQSRAVMRVIVRPAVAADNSAFRARR